MTPSFRLHTIRWLSGLPGMRIPASCGPWVARDDFVSYLEGYAERFTIVPRLGAEVQALTRDDGGWQLSTSHGELRTRQVVLATGACAQPWIPSWPGRDTLGPSLIHSSEYRNPAHVPPAIVNPLAATMRRLTIPDLSGHGLPAPTAPFSQFQRTGTVPVLDHGFVAAVRSGAIQIRAGDRALAGDNVVHDDGAISAPTAVIAATGYHTGLDGVLGPLGLIDGRGLPTFGSRGAPGAGRGLYSVGIDILLSGLLREIGKDAERVVRSIRRSDG